MPTPKAFGYSLAILVRTNTSVWWAIQRLSPMRVAGSTGRKHGRDFPSGVELFDDPLLRIGHECVAIGQTLNITQRLE
jgi:hypothetical protein